MSQSEIALFKQIITENNHRLTTARIVTFNLLFTHGPQTMGELIQRAAGEVDRVSVYRNIDLFEQLDIVSRIQTGWKYRLELSEKFVAHHHHMTCLKCGVTIDIEDEDHIDDFINRLADREGFSPRRHIFEIDGYCGRCAKNS